MKRNYLFRSILVLSLITLSYFVIRSNSNNSIEKAAICKETLDEPSKTNLPSGDMIWENISRQFIFTASELLR